MDVNMSGLQTSDSATLVFFKHSEHLVFLLNLFILLYLEKFLLAGNCFTD
jgi:hypothetical protein